MKLRVPREPFFGTNEFDGVLKSVVGPVAGAENGSQKTDKPVWPQPSRALENVAFDEMAGVQFHGHDPWSMDIPKDTPAVHPDYCEKGIEFPLGFMPHQGENRTQRRAAVATWNPKDHATAETVGAGADESGTRPDAEAAPPPPLPNRRELWAQRQRQRRGKLDPELRRIQRQKAKQR